MNIEEKAIEVLKHCKDRGFSAFDKIYFDDGTNMCIFQAIEILLTAYEKEKEKNKELQNYMKEYLIPKSTINLVYISKDKIKAKIEEVDYKMIAHQDVREAVKQVLNSLLEKE